MESEWWNKIRRIKSLFGCTTTNIVLETGGGRVQHHDPVATCQLVPRLQVEGSIDPRFDETSTICQHHLIDQKHLNFFTFCWWWERLRGTEPQT